VTTTPTGTPAASPPRELMHWDESGSCNPRCFDMSIDARVLRSESLIQKARPSVTRMDLILNWTATLPKNR